MKSIKLVGKRKMELVEVPLPKLENPGDVLIKMGVVGVCGSDIHYYTTGRIGSQIVAYPFTVGHEGAGYIERTGNAVTAVKAGDPVVVEPSISCGSCEQCKGGRPHTCLHNKFLGCPGQMEGNLSEYIVMPESQCIKLTGGLTLDDGALSEPLAIGLYANKQADTRQGDTIAILGYGPIGMSVMLTAQARGLKRIYVSEKIDSRIQIACDSGAEMVLNPNVVKVEDVIQARHGMVDIVFECCGQQDALDTAVEVAKPGGKVVIVGIPEFDRWSFTADLARRKEVAFIHVRRQNHCTEEVLAMIMSGKLVASKMITHRFPFTKAQDSFDMIAAYQDGVMKAMIDFD